MPLLSTRAKGLLKGLGEKVRALRVERDLSIRELAAAAKVSERFIALVEAGDGNPSVIKLDQIARALNCSMADILRATEDVSNRPHIVTLLGLRGAGKTTAGRLTARQLGIPFIELDQRVSERAQLPLATVFELHGEPYFRRLEREELEGIVAADQPAVVATSGSIVTSKDALSLLLSRTVSVWLRARPEDHWTRVIAQGDRRPMHERKDAMAELRALLKAREDLYSQADLRIDTHGKTALQVTAQVVSFLRGREASRRTESL